MNLIIANPTLENGGYIFSYFDGCPDNSDNISVEMNEAVVSKFNRRTKRILDALEVGERPRVKPAPLHLEELPERIRLEPYFQVSWPRTTILTIVWNALYDVLLKHGWKEGRIPDTFLPERH